MRTLRHRLVIVCLAVALTDGATSAVSVVASPAHAQSVKTPLIYWGATLEGAPSDAAKLDAFESSVGKRMSLIEWGAPWKRKGQLLRFQRENFERVRSRGSIPVLTWGSADSCCLEDQPDFQLSTIVDGTYDDYLNQWASDARTWGHPFFLRFDHEMNGWWWAWNEQANANAPGEFVQAWRHVHDIFVQQGATNVTWVWCPNIVGKLSTPLTELYPGDDYVDWTCMDGYNWGTDDNNAWQTFAQVFAGDPSYGVLDTYDQLLNLAPSKPIMIGETAASENGGSKAAWIEDMLDEELPDKFPQVKAFVWFGDVSRYPELSWPVTSSDATLVAFREGISSPVYPGNAYATLDVSPIPPPEYLVPQSYAQAGQE
jgi:mannan endo-1,4-beta-mannosidase